MGEGNCILCLQVPVIGDNVIELTAQELQEPREDKIVDTECNQKNFLSVLGCTFSNLVFHCKLCDVQGRFKIKTVCLMKIDGCHV